MTKKPFLIYNRIIGWCLFGIALTVYSATVEPTASFWDCSEYVASAYKLEIPHPPGAPLFLLIAKMFSLLAGKNTTQVAFWMNMSSVVASSATVMVLFWIISLLARKLLATSVNDLNTYEKSIIWCSGIIGALSLLFCSTFWTNATETETYALSTLLMSLSIWAMLNWDNLPPSPKRHRWILLVVYLVALSLGLRMFSLLTLPALSLLYYFNHHSNVRSYRMLLAILVGFALLAFLYVGVILGIPTLSMNIEIFLVNVVGLPFKSGIILLAVLLSCILLYGTWYTRKRRGSWHIICLSLILISIGYSSYLLVPIRAKASPPINEGDPSQIISFTHYLKREQYGHRPLIYGPHYAAQVMGAVRGNPFYKQSKDHYEIIGYKHNPIFKRGSEVLFPRTWSHQSPIHVAAYKNILGLKDWQKPDFFDQLYFFFTYQLHHAYLRYFFWNFSGRAHDMQGAPWLTFLETFKKVPPLIKQSPGRSNYFSLPLLLGLLGIAFQYRRDVRYLAVLALLFTMLGAGLLTFLNPPPIEPRERDYIYVGSFIIFTIWIGLGAMATLTFFKKLFKNTKLATCFGMLTCLTVPSVMAIQGWKVHDRSKRYFSVETAKNLLTSCAPHAILFTAGDNDTFPLWYVQEVEGFRTDVRVIVLSYTNAAWYIQQLVKKVNDSEPLPLSLDAEAYQQYGLNDFLPYVKQPNLEEPLNINFYLELIRTKDPRLQVRNMFGEFNNSLPCQELTLDIIPQHIQKQQIVPLAYTYLVPKKLSLSVKGQGLDKRDLLLLDLIQTNQWKRPIYFNHSSIHGFNLHLQPHVVTEGLALRLVPIQYEDKEELINSPVMYEKLMNQFHWKGLDQPGVYYDGTYRSLFIRNHRMSFYTLAKALIRNKELKKAQGVISHSLAVMPDKVVPYDIATAYMLKLLVELGEVEQASSIAKLLAERAEIFVSYQVKQNQLPDRATEEQMGILYEVGKSFHKAGDVTQANFYKTLLEDYENSFEMIAQRHYKKLYPSQ